MGPYGTIFDHTRPYGTIRDDRGPYGAIWDHMGPYGTVGIIRYHMVPYGTLWYHAVPYGTVQYHTVPYGAIRYHTLPIGPYRTIDSYFKLMVVFQNIPNIRPQMAQDLRHRTSQRKTYHDTRPLDIRPPGTLLLSGDQPKGMTITHLSQGSTQPALV